MEKNSKFYLFEQATIPSAVAQLAVPTVISSLVMIIYNLADTYFVGMLNSALETAAVTLAAPVLLAFYAVSNLFGVGTSSVMSRAMGAKDYDMVKRSSAFGFYSALFCALLYSVLISVFMSPLMRVLGATGDNIAPTAEYLKWTVSFGSAPAIMNMVLAYFIRSEGAALHAGIGTMSGCVLNIFLDPLFILPKYLGMGASGAGCATFISNSVACLYFIVYILVKRKTTFVCVDIAKAKPDRTVIKEIFTVGIPAAIQNLLNVTGMMILNNFVASFGSEAVAAMGISQKITMIPMYISNGLSQGVMPLVGYNYAAKNQPRMKNAVVFTGGVSAVILVVMTAGCYAFATPIVRMFMKNAIIVSYGSAFMRGLCLAQPFLAIDFLAVGVFQACGMGQRSLLFAFLRKIVLEIPAILILNKLFQMYGLAYAQLCAEFILAVTAIICLASIFRKLEKEKKTV